jgi:restriction endonuclease S subunit
MTNNNSTYKRLGDYIREVDVRNKDLRCTNLLGLSIAKKFIPSIANMVGTDLRPYKIVKHNQFAYVPVTSRNGEKITVALYTGNEPAIISQAYVVFEIVGTCDTVETVCTPSLQCDQLLPEYLMMWFRRAEFDRYARYHSHGSAREVFDWEEMCNVMLPIPSIEEQRKIVTRYKAIETRISNNKQTIAKLEEAAQALYRKMFVDDVDVENLPDGWRMGTIKEFCKEMKSGGTPSRTNNSYWDSNDIPWLKSGEVHNNVIWKTEDYISESGLKNSSAKLIPADSVIMAMYGATAAQVAYLKCETTTNQACCNMVCHSKEDAAYLYFHLLNHQDEIKVLANGGAQENLSQELIANQPIIIGCGSNKFTTIIEQISLLTKDNEKLIEMLSLMA